MMTALEIIRFSAGESRPMTATIGFFDGVHRGHRFLFDQVRAESDRRGTGCLAVTFAEHPRSVLTADGSPHLLTGRTEKLARLRTCGFDACALLHFTPELAALSAKDFMRRFLYDMLDVRCLVVGYDHRFGHDRSAGFADYQAWGVDMGMDVVQAKSFENAGFTVSSSAIRRFVSDGKVDMAAEALGYAYELAGTVVGGHRVGRQIGFPTANLRPAEPLKLIPANGVYAARAYVGGNCYGAMVNIGRRPTLDNGNDCTVEAHLFGFSGDIYNESLTLSFERRLRDERKFATVEQLREQLENDAVEAKDLLKL